jgi:hypothetical protein
MCLPPTLIDDLRLGLTRRMGFLVEFIYDEWFTSYLSFALVKTIGLLSALRDPLYIRLSLQRFS